MEDFNEILNDLVQALQSAALREIMPRFRDRAFSIGCKGAADDVVTDADIGAERAITERLQSLYPMALIVGEEAASTAPALLSGLSDADLAFILDPLDGTSNFAAGLPLFTVIGAIASRGRTVAGAIVDPVCGDAMFAVMGSGAWHLSRHGERRKLASATARPLRNSRAAGLCLNTESASRAAVISRLSGLGSFSALRCAGHEYRMMASGHYDFSIYMGEPLHPWDHAAGILLCREAGGYAATLQGELWEGLTPATSLLCASSRAQWQSAEEHLNGQQ